MQITKTSIVTGVTRTLEIDVTQEQLDDWKSGTLIQVAMPHLSIQDREFLISGMTPEEWAEMSKQQKDFDLKHADPEEVDKCWECQEPNFIEDLFANIADVRVYLCNDCLNKEIEKDPDFDRTRSK